MKYHTEVEAARLSDGMEVGGRRGEAGDYLVVCRGADLVLLPAATFEMLFRPANGGGPVKSAREPKAKEEPGRKKEPGRTAPGGMGQMVIEALGEGPKLSREVGDWIRAHGLPDYTNTRTSAVLTYLKKRGLVERGKDEKWRVKE